MVLWGIGLGAQESIMRAAIAGMVPADQRASAYGVFNAGFGLYWFFGSAIMGWFYDVSIFNLIAFSVVTQVSAIPLLWMARTPGR
jgi:MFS-type transporter involved in bile tolerance (Atg22 family)